jgi:hypothetical protein
VLAIRVFEGVLRNILFTIPMDFCYITKLLHAESFHNTINDSEIQFQEFVIKGRNILRSVLFPV